jgi:TRPM family ion channel
MSLFSSFTIEFENKNKAFALRDVPQDASPEELLVALELPDFRGVITLVLAAGSMPPDILDATRELFTKGLAPVAEKLCLLVVDGASRVGGMMAMGDARQSIAGTFPLVGVIPIGVVKLPQDLDPFHSHFVLVNGNNYGDEAAVLPGFLKATTKPGVVIIVNCRVESPYMSSEFPRHAQWADMIIPIRNSGGVADALLDTEGALYKSLPAKAVVKGIDLREPEALAALLEEIFASK